jgi:subtilisin family serine protease
MTSRLRLYQITALFVLLIIGTVFFGANAVAKSDKDLAVQSDLPEVNVTETITVSVTQSPVVTTQTTEPGNQDRVPAVTETVTETPTQEPTEETTSPAVTETVTETPTQEPGEETTLPVVIETVTETPTEEPTEEITEPTVTETISVNTTVSPEVSPSIAATIAKTASKKSTDYVEGEVIVRYNYKKIPNKTTLHTQSVKTNGNIGAVVKKDFSDEGLPGMQVVSIPENMSVDEAIALYESDPNVLYAEPNHILHIASTVTPSDYYFASTQWGLNNSGQNIQGSVGTADADIDAPEAWSITTGSGDVIVAVIDTGVNDTHPDLSANIWTNANDPINGVDDDGNGKTDDYHGWNFFDDNNDTSDGNTNGPPYYHGTHCAGILGAVGNNTVGIAGVAWNVSIMPLRVTNADGDLYTSDAIEAITYANLHDVSIMSLSWGSIYYDQDLKDAIDASPALFMCAAGNDATSVPFYPAAYDSDNIISVTATDNQDNFASSFANYNATYIDLAAPGVDIYSTKPTSTYQYLSGTSMTAPLVAGVAALIKSENSSLTNAEIKSAILDNVDVLASLDGKVATGGRLNAYRTLAAVAGVDIGTTKIGVLRNSRYWYLDYNGNGAWNADIDKSYGFGVTGDVPVTGDWNGNGITEIGVFRSPRYWYLDYNGNDAWNAGIDKSYGFGVIGDTPVTGNWDGN